MADPNENAVAAQIGTVGADGEVTRRGWRSLWFVLIVQAQNAFNDKVAQYVLLSVSVFALAGSEFSAYYKSVVAFLLTVPFIIFAPLAGWLADRFSKRRVMLWCLIAQLAVLFFISVSLFAGSIWVATFGFSLLAIQSAFFSPAKLGILKEVVGVRKLTVASGWAQMLAIFGIIAGTALGGYMFKWLKEAGDLSWQSAAFYSINIIGVLSIGAIFAGIAVVRTPSGTSEKLHVAILFQHFGNLAQLLRERSLRLTALGISYFWFAGVLVTLIVIEAAEVIAESKEEVGALSSLLSAYIGIGIALGSGVVSVISWKRNELGIIPIGGFGMAGIGILAGCIPMDGLSFQLAMISIGFFAGFFFVPLNALLQELAPPDRRGRIIAASGLLDSIAILAGIGFQALMTAMHMDPQWQFICMGVLTFLASIYVLRILPQNFARFMFASFLRFAYRIRPLDDKNLPKTGGALLVANHMSYIDAFMIGAAYPRTVRFVVFDHYMKVWWIRWVLNLFGAIPIAPTRAKAGIRSIANALKAGDLVCIFPEGQLSRTGTLNEFKKGFELMARQAKAPVIPVYLDGVWGSIFSFERNRFIFKRPHRIPYRVTVAFGKPLEQSEVDAEAVRCAVMQLGAAAIGARREVHLSPERFVVDNLISRPWKICMIDVSKRRRALKRSMVFATAVQLGEQWRKELTGDRVAVLLPPGTSVALANLALWMSGKVPVNIPFAAAENPDAVARLYKDAGISCIVSSRMIKEKIEDFPWPDHFADMVEEMKSLTGSALFWESIRSFVEPKFWTRRRLRLKKIERSPGAEAACSVYLDDRGAFQIVSHSSHKLLAGGQMIGSANGLVQGVRIINGYSLDTVPGMMIGLIYGLAMKTPVVHLPLSIDTQKLGDLLRREGDVQVVAEKHLIAGLSKVPYAVSGDHLTRVFTFDDTCTEEIRDSLRERFDRRIFQGLALDECGAVVALSMPEPVAETETADRQPGSRDGAVGKLLPGIGAAMRAPDSGEPLPLTSPEPADLHLSGPAVEAGGVSAVIHCCRVDADGFLFLARNGGFTGKTGDFEEDGS